MVEPDFPEGHEYHDFEIPLEAKQNLKEIERCLKETCYTDEAMVREHLDLLENLDAEVTSCIDNERRISRYNATLKHDQEWIRRLIKDLEVELRRFD